MEEAIHGTATSTHLPGAVNPVENDRSESESVPSILVLEADNDNTNNIIGNSVTVAHTRSETGKGVTHDEDGDENEDEGNDNDNGDLDERGPEKDYDEYRGDISGQQQQKQEEDPGYNSSASSTDELAQMKSRTSSRSSFSSIPDSVVVHHRQNHHRNCSKEGQRLGSRSQSPTTVADTGGSFDYHAHDGGGEDEDYDSITNDNNNGTIRRTQKQRSKSKPKPKPTGIGFGGTLRSLRNVRREREMAFRHPSSVRDMQMHTEDEYGDDYDYDDEFYDDYADDAEYLTPPLRRRGYGHGRHHSAGSLPLRRSPYYSPTRGAPVHHRQQQTPPPQPPITKEYPLVLLHCNLLPPTLSLPASLGVPDQRLLQEVLPPQYWRRWKFLEEKVGLGIVRDRGVLISHPQDMYDLLEERLLVSLELQRPRFHGGHFLARETVSEKDSQNRENDNDNTMTKAQRLGAEEESCTDEEQGQECPDCGRKVVRYSSDSEDGASTGKRKWEVRVFAANGLMRAGAWAAAWKEMEKVDVEVGLWLPSDVRRELERRVIAALQDASIRYDEFRPSSSLSSRHSIMPDEGGRGEVRIPPLPPAAAAAATVLAPPPPSLSQLPSMLSQPSPISDTLAQEQIDGSDDQTRSDARSKSIPNDRQEPIPKPASPLQQNQKTPTDIDFQTLLINYIRILASDRRNIAIMVLSLLVVFLAVGALRFGGNGNIPLLSSSLSLLDSGRGSILSLSQQSGGRETDLLEAVEV